jgi:hypothetical protein
MSEKSSRPRSMQYGEHSTQIGAAQKVPRAISSKKGKNMVEYLMCLNMMKGDLHNERRSLM